MNDVASWSLLGAGLVASGLGAALTLGRTRVLISERNEVGLLMLFFLGLILVVDGCGLIAYALIRVFGLLTTG